MVERVMPRERSTRKPSTISATAVTKPALACVTSTPALLAAATSTLRMSIAQRRKAASFGRRSNSAAGLGDRAVQLEILVDRVLALRGGAVHRLERGGDGAQLRARRALGGEPGRLDL